MERYTQATQPGDPALSAYGPLFRRYQTTGTHDATYTVTLGATSGERSQLDDRQEIHTRNQLGNTGKYRRVGAHLAFPQSAITPT
jgi:hypothetical protein